MNVHLWAYDDRGFLPHGSHADGHAGLQPVWLTVDDEIPNGATVLFLTDGRQSALLNEVELVCDLFDGNDPAAMEAARNRWRLCKDAGHALTYWQQTERGGWERKADG